MTADENSVESALIWTDNPELAYFRSMMTTRKDERIRAGLNADDSLIGGSIIRDMLKDDDNDERDATGNGVLPPHRPRDTSGLSDVENDTVDNIYMEDESILMVDKNANMTLPDEGSRQSRDNKEDIEETPTKHLEQITNSNEQFQRKPSNGGDGPIVPLSFQRYSVGDDVAVTRSYPRNIPGVIFVTDGHSSVIETHTTDKADFNNDDEGSRGRREERRFQRRMIVFVAVLLMVVAVIVGMLLARKQLDAFSSNSSSSALSGSLVPTSTPTKFASSGFRPNSQPTIPTTEGPTPDPVAMDVEEPAPEAPEPSSGRETRIPTYQPTRISSPVPSRTAIPPSIASPTASPSLSSNEQEVDIPTESSTPSPSIVPTSSPEEAGNSLNNTLEPSSIIDGTQVPTFFPTSLTSQDATTMISETPQDPADCVSSISTHKTCYQNGDTMEITFKNCNATSQDWIGIFPAHLAVEDLRNPLDWIWACGTRFCNTVVADGEASLRRVQGSGDFRIFLLRDDDASNWGFLASSIGNEFTVSTSCN